MKLKVQDNKRRAFTLAEVLITLTIIGIIAALTIPNLMQKWEDAHTVSAVKEAYTIIDNALKTLIREEGIRDLTELDWPYKIINTSAEHAATYVYFNEKISHYLKVRKNGGCPNDNVSKCLVLANGMYIYMNMRYPSMYNNDQNSFVGTVTIDINGQNKGPNKYGFDKFQFQIYYNGLFVPYPGASTNPNYKVYSGQELHNPQYCQVYKGGNGESCSTWIMLKGNVDYKYRDVTDEWKWW